MTIIRNIIVAFSMYSVIPMPHFIWKENDTKYSLSFITLIGLVIGAIEYGVLVLSQRFEIPVFVTVFLWAGIPLLITGGFHLDGFMDTMDALKSYKSKEEKLKILKDPHIGAFAVISLAMYGCFYLAFTYLLTESDDFSCKMIVCIGFAFARAMGAFLSLVLKLAKNDGMLHTETKDTNIASKIILIVSMLLLIGVAVYINWIVAMIEVGCLLIFILIFRAKCYRELGGISGDTIGYFITVAELIIMMVAAIACRCGL